MGGDDRCDALAGVDGQRVAGKPAHNRTPANRQPGSNQPAWIASSYLARYGTGVGQAFHVDKRGSRNAGDCPTPGRGQHHRVPRDIVHHLRGIPWPVAGPIGAQPERPLPCHGSAWIENVLRTTRINAPIESILKRFTPPLPHPESVTTYCRRLRWRRSIKPPGFDKFMVPIPSTRRIELAPASSSMRWCP